MKVVSYKVAQAIKDAGYSQMYIRNHWYYYHEDLVVPVTVEDFKVVDCIAPTYLEAWIWLCDHISYIGKRKLLSINMFKGRIKWELSFNCERLDSDDNDCYYEFMGNTQEEVIKKAIEYLVDNDLIK